MKRKLAIYALHPISYQTPIFTELQSYIDYNKLEYEFKVLYGDPCTLKEITTPEHNTSFNAGTPFLLDGYNYKFIKNYSKSIHKGFLSRVNPEIVRELILGQYDAILIHGYDNLTSWLALLTAKILGIKVIWRGESVLKGNESKFAFKPIFKKFVLKLFFKLCNAIMYSCTGNKNYLEFYGVHKQKMFSIPCAVNNKFFLNEKEKIKPFVNNIKTKLNIPEENLVLLFSARFTDRKRPLDLLEALSYIKNDNITALFVGDGLIRNEIEKNVKKYNINAVFVGMQGQTEIAEYYSIADVAIIISEYDPSPKAMNEAMLFELPIIATEVIGTVNDLIHNEENGFIIKVGDINKLAEKITLFNNNRDLLKTMGQKSLAIVEGWNYERDVEGVIKALYYCIKTEK